MSGLAGHLARSICFMKNRIICRFGFAGSAIAVLMATWVCGHVSAATGAGAWALKTGEPFEGEFLRIQGDDGVFKAPSGELKKVDLGELDAPSRQRASQLWGQHLSAAVKRIDEAVESKLREQGIQPNPALSDEQYVRRIYLDVTGTIPTYTQTMDFLMDRDPQKRFKLVSSLLEQEGNVSHMYNIFADMYRIQDLVPGTYLRTDAFSHWIKEQLRENRPYNEFVYDMLTSTGRIWEDPASGFYLRDFDTPLDHVQYTAKVLLGTDIACAQCHDDPFQDWTMMDYYRLTAFLGELETEEPVKRALPKSEMEKVRQEVIKRHDIDMKAEDAEQKLRQAMQRYQQPVRWMTDAAKLTLKDNPSNRTTLPDIYIYADGKPGDIIMPLVPFGNDPDYIQGQNSPREQYARWMTSPENPRFAMNIANRMWNNFFGRAVALPLHNIDPETAENPELLKVLEEEMVAMGFDLRTFAKVLASTSTYNRLSTNTSVSEADPYYFQGPVLRRMSAEQVWDSLMTLMVDDPLRFRKGDGAYFYEVANILDREGPMTADEFFERAEGYMKYESGLTNYLDMKGEGGASGGVHVEPVKMEMMEGMRNRQRQGVEGLTYGNLLLARASEVEQPAKPEHFLRMFGQSERNFVEGASSRGGSVPQVMEMMNGFATEIITKPDSMLFQEMDRVGRDRMKKADIVFMSILNRKSDTIERDLIYKELERGSEEKAYANLIWALLNTPEFFFIK